MTALNAALDFFHATAALWRAVPPWLWLAIYALWLISAVLFMLRQRRPATTTLAWLMAFMMLPFIGGVAYLIMGPRRLQRRNVRRTVARAIAARVGRGEVAVLPDKLADRAWLVSLARVACSSNDGPPRPAQSLQLFAGGDETYDAIDRAIRAARRQVHLEYYIFEPDAVGQRIRDALIERACVGIKVRVLIDALGSGKAKPAFWAPLVQAGGEVRLFNPPRFLRFQPGQLNFRTHRKIVVVDGVHAFTGGINVSAGNSALSSGGHAWRDTHLEVRGAPALDLQMIFLEDWLFAGEETAPASTLESSGEASDAALQALQIEAGDWFPAPPAPAEGHAGPWVQIIDSGPDERVFDIHRYFFTAITSARRRLWITTPYFVPDEPILTALSTAAARGVDVRIIVPQQGDSKLVTAAASTFADEMAAQGVPVFEYCGRMIHAKTMVVDDELAVVGTANMDNRSFRLNFEVIAAVYDRDFTDQLAALFLQDQQQCQQVDMHRGNTISRVQHMMASLARLFAPVL